MFKCEKCGRLYEDLTEAKNEINYVEDTDGRTRDIESEYVCHCGGELEEVHKCKYCNEYISLDETCCEKCITLENCLEIGEENKKTIKINGFLGVMFSEEEITEILIREMKEAEKLGGINKFDYREYLEEYD